MTNWTELKRLAEAAKEEGEWFEAGCALYSYYDRPDADFMVASSPATILALIAENDRLRGDVRMLVRQHMPLQALEGMEGWSEVVEARKAVEQRDQLRAEVEALRDALMMVRNHSGVNSHQIELIDSALKANQ